MLSSLIVLRHAEAGDRATWSHDDYTRPLNRHGLQQALDIGRRLRRTPIEQIFTSPYARCHHSVAPLAGVRRLPIVSCPWLSADTSQEDVTTGILTLTGSILLCTHRQALLYIANTLCTIHGLPDHLVTDLRDGLPKSAAVLFELESQIATRL